MEFTHLTETQVCFPFEKSSSRRPCGFPVCSPAGLEQPSLEGVERRLEYGGGGLAGAQLVVRPPGSSGSGFQQHQELCRCARGSEGKAPVRQQGAVHGGKDHQGAVGRGMGLPRGKTSNGNGTNTNITGIQPVAQLPEVLDVEQKPHRL